MTDLPWDRFGEPEELPYVPPPTHPVTLDPYPVEPESETSLDTPRRRWDDDPLPPRPSSSVVDWDKLLDDAWPMIKDQLTDYVRGTIQAGFDVDHAHPTVTATTKTGKELVIADAKSRSWRTLVQGLAFDVIAAIVVVISTLSGADLFNQDTWIAFGILLGKSVVSAVISYFMRLRVTPTARDEEGEKVNVLPLMVPVPEVKAA